MSEGPQDFSFGLRAGKTERLPGGMHLITDLEVTDVREIDHRLPVERIDPEQLARAGRRIDDLCRLLARRWQPVVDEAARVFGQLQAALREAGMLPEQPPEDPRERALWARRQRNTGPARPGPEKRRRGR